MTTASAGKRRPWARLGLLAVVLLLALRGVNHYVQWSVIQTGEQTVGAKVEVGASRLSLLNGRVKLRHLTVANPRAPMQNLVEARDCEFTLDPEALLYRRAVVRHGEVRGLEFGTSRTTSGALDGVSAAAPLPWTDWLDSKSVVAAQQWLEQLELLFQQDLSDELRSVRLTEELLARWPDEYVALAKRVREFRERTVEFQDQIEEAQANPLRHVQFLDDLPDQIAAMRSQYQELKSEVDALPDLADADRRAIVAARRHDEQLRYDQLQIEPIDADMLSAYLMQRQLAEPLSDLIGWLRWMRQLVPADGRPAQPVFGRGEDVQFAGCPRTPKLLIRSLDLSGITHFGRQRFAFTGALTDYASEPVLHNRPLELRLKSEGSLSLELHATIDRTGPVARDEFALDCHGLAMPESVLGGSEKMRLSLAPTTGSLVVRLVIEGEELSGDIQLAQDRAQVSALLGGGLGRSAVVDALDRSLRNVDSVTTRVSLRGTLGDPQWHVASSLGPALAQATAAAFRQAARDHAAQVVTRSQRHVDEQLAGLDRQISRQQKALQPQLSESTDVLDKIARRQQQGERISYERLGDRLPSGSLFR